MQAFVKSQEARLLGKISCSEKRLIGCMSIPVGFENYNGDYNVVPKMEGQTLETQDKRMTKNVTIEPIPFYEVSNPQGGITFIIGGNE